MAVFNYVALFALATQVIATPMAQPGSALSRGGAYEVPAPFVLAKRDSVPDDPTAADLVETIQDLAADADTAATNAGRLP